MRKYRELKSKDETYRAPNTGWYKAGSDRLYNFGKYEVWYRPDRKIEQGYIYFKWDDNNGEWVAMRSKLGLTREESKAEIKTYIRKLKTKLGGIL